MSLVAWPPEALAFEFGEPDATLGEPERAAALASEELRLARRWGAPRAVSVALRTAGLAAGGAAGLDCLSER